MPDVRLYQIQLMDSLICRLDFYARFAVFNGLTRKFSTFFSSISYFQKFVFYLTSKHFSASTTNYFCDRLLVSNFSLTFSWFRPDYSVLLIKYFHFNQKFMVSIVTDFGCQWHIHYFQWRWYLLLLPQMGKLFFFSLSLFLFIFSWLSFLIQFKPSALCGENFCTF